MPRRSLQLLCHEGVNGTDNNIEYLTLARKNAIVRIADTCELKKTRRRSEWMEAANCWLTRPGWGCMADVSSISRNPGTFYLSGTFISLDLKVKGTTPWPLATSTMLCGSMKGSLLAGFKFFEWLPQHNRLKPRPFSKMQAVESNTLSPTVLVIWSVLRDLIGRWWCWRDDKRSCSGVNDTVREF